MILNQFQTLNYSKDYDIIGITEPGYLITFLTMKFSQMFILFVVMIEIPEVVV